MALGRPPRALTNTGSPPAILLGPNLDRQWPLLLNSTPGPPDLLHLKLNSAIRAYWALLPPPAAPPTASLPGSLGGLPPDWCEGQGPGDREDPSSACPSGPQPGLRGRRPQVLGDGREARLSGRGDQVQALPGVWREAGLWNQTRLSHFTGASLLLSAPPLPSLGQLLIEASTSSV